MTPEERDALICRYQSGVPIEEVLAGLSESDVHYFWHGSTGLGDEVSADDAFLDALAEHTF